MSIGNSFYIRFVCSLALFLCCGTLSVTAQEHPPLHPKIEQLMNPDGTFRSPAPPSGIDGNRGSLQELPSPFLARPASSPDDIYWDDRFGGAPGSSGVDDEIFAMTTDGKNLYIGGAFRRAGELDLNNMTVWNGEAWGRVGIGPGVQNGVNGFVNAMAILYGVLYTGGQFDSGGGRAMMNIGAYDIQRREWYGIGDISATSGFASVNAICVDGDNIYVGGVFDRVDGRPMENIAGYNVLAKRWFPLDSGIQGTVNAIAKGPDGIYVGGSFSSAGSVAAASIARWDGGEWHELDGGVKGFVNAIAVMDSSVFVAGGFTQAGDTIVSNIARWRPDTTTWTRLSGLFWIMGQNGEPDNVERLEGNGVDNVVRSLTVRGNELYVGGTFLSAYPGDYTTSPVAVRYVARWYEFPGDPKYNTLTWSRLGQGVNGFVNAMEYYDGGVYAAGSFTRAEGQPADGIARWDGLRWYSLASGTGNNIFALDAAEGDIWVGGVFNQPGEGKGNRLAYLNGSKWELVPGKFSGNVFSLAVHGDWVYVGGQFDGVGSLQSKNVVRWNRITNEWSTLGSKGSPLNPDGNDFVSEFAFDGDYVYLGGDFTTAGGIPAYSIVRWNSATDTWESLGRGINGQVFAILPHGDDVYVGGRFLGAGNLLSGPARDALNIALWKDGEWMTLGEGVDEVVWDMILKENKVYVGGSFDSAGTMPAKRIVAWDLERGEWTGVGTGLDDHFLPMVSSLSTDGRYIYAGGNFTTTGNHSDSVHYVGRWNGESWQNLGSGVNSYVYVVDVEEKSVYVAGAFGEAGGKSSFYFGIYADPVLSVETGAGQVRMTLEESSPNPFTDGTMIRFQTTATDHVSLDLFDVEGKRVARLIDNRLPAGDHRILWEPDQSVPSGAYVVRLTAGRTVLTGKLIRK